MTTPHTLLITLAQSSVPKASSSALIWVVVLIIAVMILGAALMVLRKKMFEPDASESQAGLLETLRAMHRRGELSDGEFEAARRKMQASIKRQVEQRAAAIQAARPGQARRPDNRARTLPRPDTDRGNRGKIDDGSGGLPF